MPRTHAEAVTEVLVLDLVLSEVAIDELWSFVSDKGDEARRHGPAILPRPRGDASRVTGSRRSARPRQW